MIISEKILRDAIKIGSRELERMEGEDNTLARKQLIWMKNNAHFLAGVIVAALDDHVIGGLMRENLDGIASHDENVNAVLFGHDVRMVGTEGEEKFQEGQ